MVVVVLAMEVVVGVAMVERFTRWRSVGVAIDCRGWERSLG